LATVARALSREALDAGEFMLDDGYALPEEMGLTPTLHTTSVAGTERHATERWG
jgi:hypothetical protein